MVVLKRIIPILLVFAVFSAKAQSSSIVCKATVYHNVFENRKTATGDIFSQKKYTAAHKTIALNTLVKVTNLDNDYSVLVKVNDRCPKKGILDLSLAAARAIDLHKVGVTKVKVEIMHDSLYPQWEQQADSLPPIVWQRHIQDSLQTRYEDSLLFASGFNLPENVSYFFVRAASASTPNECRYIRLHLPNEYRPLVRAKLNRKTRKYEIILGPFFTRVEAEECIKRIRGKYPYSRLETVN